MKPFKKLHDYKTPGYIKTPLATAKLMKQKPTRRKWNLLDNIRGKK